MYKVLLDLRGNAEEKRGNMILLIFPEINNKPFVSLFNNKLQFLKQKFSVTYFSLTHSMTLSHFFSITTR